MLTRTYTQLLFLSLSGGLLSLEVSRSVSKCLEVSYFSPAVVKRDEAWCG